MLSRLLTRARRVRHRLAPVRPLPRLSVFRSNVHISAQIIDDQSGRTLVAASDYSLSKGTKIERAQAVGASLAKLALSAKITQVVFDRGPYRYHGRIKALAESARQTGLTI